VRILPGTCVTFVVYEQVSRWLERMGEKKKKNGIDALSTGGDRSRGEIGGEGG